jgi:hypothetical protein
LSKLNDLKNSLLENWLQRAKWLINYPTKMPLKKNFEWGKADLFDSVPHSFLSHSLSTQWMANLQGFHEIFRKPNHQKSLPVDPQRSYLEKFPGKISHTSIDPLFAFYLHFPWIFCQKETKMNLNTIYVWTFA